MNEKNASIISVIVVFLLFCFIISYSVRLCDKFDSYEDKVLQKICYSYELTDMDKHDIRLTFQENRYKLWFGYSFYDFFIVYIDSQKYIVEKETGYLYRSADKPLFDDEGKHIVYEHYDKIINYLNKE